MTHEEIKDTCNCDNISVFNENDYPYEYTKSKSPCSSDRSVEQLQLFSPHIFRD